MPVFRILEAALAFLICTKSMQITIFVIVYICVPVINTYLTFAQYSCLTLQYTSLFVRVHFFFVYSTLIFLCTLIYLVYSTVILQVYSTVILPVCHTFV